MSLRRFASTAVTATSLSISCALKNALDCEKGEEDEADATDAAEPGATFVSPPLGCGVRATAYDGGGAIIDATLPALFPKIPPHLPPILCWPIAIGVHTFGVQSYSSFNFGRVTNSRSQISPTVTLASSNPYPGWPLRSPAGHTLNCAWALGVAGGAAARHTLE